MHETYFRHLRLYDFVLKNTKLSEVKRVNIPVAEPKSGESLSKAMVIADVNSMQPGASPDKVGASGMQSYAAAGGMSGAMGMSNAYESVDATMNKDMTMGTEHGDGESVTDSDMDDKIKTMSMDRKARNVMHRVTKGWNERISAAVAKEPDLDANPPPKSGGR